MGFIVSTLGGNFRGLPEDVFGENGISPGARQLLDDVFTGLDCSKIIDYHTHVAGRGTDDTKCSLHPSMVQGYNLFQRVKAKVFLSATGCDITDRDVKFVNRLRSLVEHSCRHPSEPQGRVHGRNLLLAFDHVYDADDHTVIPHLSSIYTPNDYVLKLSEESPDHFIAACSVHPFRSDVVAELERCAEQGVHVIKWLPNVMAFSPGDPKCDLFYDTAKRLGMTILCHVGDEHSLTAGALDNTNGNPLHLRRALDKGVKVIMAHCATEGYYPHPEHRRPVPGVDVFLWMMRRDEYKDLLFADISAITALKRAKHIQVLLESDDIHDRLVFGSDYPVPAISLVTSTKLLWWYGLLTWEQTSYLNEIYSFNPLLYDIAVKRTIRCPRTGRKFPNSIFQEHPKLRVSGRSA